MTEFAIAVKDAFNAAKDGRRDLTKWANNCLEPVESQNFGIAVKFAGRYTLRVHLPRFDLYASSFEFFKLGWIFQFIGHAIEGNQPAFFKNPMYLLVGPWWVARRAATAIGLLKASSPKKASHS